MGGQTGGIVSRVSFLLFPHPWNVLGVWLGGTQIQVVQKCERVRHAVGS
jgi:hypothetical protein